jgi:hypothetical protein
MDLSDQYRVKAQECLQMAKRLPPTLQPALLKLATDWLQMAMRSTVDELHAQTKTRCGGR